jgi:hypothetical protein
MYAVLATELKAVGHQHGYKAQVVFSAPPGEGRHRSIMLRRHSDGAWAALVKVECRERDVDEVIDDMIAGYLAANGRARDDTADQAFIREAREALRAASSRSIQGS